MKAKWGNIMTEQEMALLFCSVSLNINSAATQIFAIVVFMVTQQQPEFIVNV